MAKKNHTKKALISSLLALFICFTMLIGTTFAWFTDSAVSANNVIKSGNLDIEVEYTLDGETWAALDGAKDLFENVLWEPGHTRVVALKIKNAGNLALKYKVDMNVTSNTIGKTAGGEDIDLTEILKVSTLVQQANDVGAVALSLAFMGEDRVAYENPVSFKAGNVLSNDVELHPGDEHYAFIKVDMPETVGNEANHDGVNIPSIQFGLNVLAAQYTYESDTFGNQYDVNAEYAATDYATAKVTREDPMEVQATIGMGGGAPVTRYLDPAFTFETTQTKEEAQESKYRYWHADFVVKVEGGDIGANEAALAGYYAAYCKDYNKDNWVALQSDGTIPKETEIRLLDSMLNGGSINYGELCEHVPVFKCGVADLSNGNLHAKGVKITVELRLYETEEPSAGNGNSHNVETGNYVTIGTYKHTF